MSQGEKSALSLAAIFIKVSVVQLWLANHLFKQFSNPARIAAFYTELCKVVPLTASIERFQGSAAACASISFK